MGLGVKSHLLTSADSLHMQDPIVTRLLEQGLLGTHHVNGEVQPMHAVAGMGVVCPGAAHVL